MGVQVPATAAVGVRQFQELRGLVTRCFHGRQWRRDAWQGRLVRAEGGGSRRRQEEVSWGSAIEVCLLDKDFWAFFVAILGLRFILGGPTRVSPDLKRTIFGARSG